MTAVHHMSHPVPRQSMLAGDLTKSGARQWVAQQTLDVNVNQIRSRAFVAKYFFKHLHLCMVYADDNWLSVGNRRSSSAKSLSFEENE
jgi:hypothetical protein